MIPRSLLVLVVLLAGCKGCQDPAESGVPEDDTAPDVETDTGPTLRPLRVLVTLDGVPAPDTTVLQGGAKGRWITDENGEVTITVDLSVVGDIEVMGSRADARIQGEIVRDDDYADTAGAFLVELARFDTSDNPAYLFQDPGEGEWAESNTEVCLHCHRTLHEEWTLSAHRTATRNITVQDVYQGTALALDEADCADGVWTSVVEPGSGQALDACVVEEDARGLPEYGACANCHAPGIDGDIGGRDLLDATGIAYDNGVHCDVCHRVESVDVTQAPGVGGVLHLLRPTEEPLSPALGAWAPLTFGPYDDVPNPRMGAVQRTFFEDAELCAGCHEAVIPPTGGAIDPARWPSGSLPFHTTFTEWQAGPMNPSSPCQTCHMPPKPEAANAADLDPETESGVGVAGGWYRDPGSVQSHGFFGPRQPDAGFLSLAATVSVSLAEASGELVATVVTKNVAAGHRIPTGEPMRALLLQVTATCEGEPLPAVGGDVLPAWAGAAEERGADEDWTRWPAAEVGEQLAVVTDLGGWVDYEGYGAFGDGTFTAEQKGLPTEGLVGVVTVTEVAGDGTVTTEPALPLGDRVYRLIPTALAGTPGWAFARVTANSAGEVMVPHAFATDIVSDNRLAPQQSWTSTHRFEACAAGATVTATLVHRNYPWAEATARGWALQDQEMDSETVNQ